MEPLDLFGPNGFINADKKEVFIDVLMSKYPPAEPGALRLLAPQRGLIAIDRNQN
jgi:hypothetical protein